MNREKICSSKQIPKNHFRKFNNYEKLVSHDLKSYYRNTVLKTFCVMAQLQTLRRIKENRDPKCRFTRLQFLIF